MASQKKKKIRNINLLANLKIDLHKKSLGKSQHLEDKYKLLEKILHILFILNKHSSHILCQSALG